ncbi:outer membrane beta-barrel protein [Legionella saoudiensis]|uniref:outer membrane beta-barrel protein n=1 Tax=Legionella saoudiensis TaxID=1750561 RepID=UPI000731D157|nr:outer membrane beta-barrel protein [Legionella saoudiensis]
MNKNLLVIVMLILAKASIAASFYAKFGADYLWSGSDNYTYKRTDPIAGSISPEITPGSLNSSNGAGSVALGMSHFLNPDWRLSLEASYLQLSGYAKKFNRFMAGSENVDLINTFHSRMNGNVLTAIVNIDYILKRNYSLYVAPGLGIANLTAHSRLNYQAYDYEEELIMKSHQDQTNFSPQVAVGLKYVMTQHLMLDLGISYIWLGKVRFGALSRESDAETKTEVIARNTYLLGPKLNLIYYFN